MTALQIAVIAIVAWQIATLIVFLVCGQDDGSLVVGMLVPWLILYALLALCRHVYFTFAKRKLNRYRVGWTDEEGRELISCTCFYTTEHWANKMCRRGEGKYFIEFDSGCKNIKSAPHMSEIYHGQKRFMGWTDMSKFFTGGDTTCTGRFGEYRI